MQLGVQLGVHSENITGCNISLLLGRRKKNKWLPKIHQWTQEHGGGIMIPFSIEWEQKLWNLRDDPDGLKAFLDQEPKSVSALPKMIVQGYKELVGNDHVDV